MKDWYVIPGEDQMINLNALRSISLDTASNTYVLIGDFIQGDHAVVLFQGTKDECMDALRRILGRETR